MWSSSWTLIMATRIRPPRSSSLWNIYQPSIWFALEYVSIKSLASDSVGLEPTISANGAVLWPTELLSQMVTRRRIELLSPPWKGDVLTVWPTGHCFWMFLRLCIDRTFKLLIHSGGLGGTLTHDLSVNGRLLPLCWATKPFVISFF